MRHFFISKSQRQHLLPSSSSASHHHDADANAKRERERDGDEAAIHLAKKQKQQQIPERERKLFEEAINEHFRYSFSKNNKKRVVSKKLRFSWDNTEDTTRLYEPFPLFFCHANAKKPKNEREKKRKHWSEKKLEEMTERDWHIFREDFNISYKGRFTSGMPRPMRSWAESRLGSDLLRAVHSAGYKTPSPIQMATIPLGLKQRDVIGIAQTGSGKTAAFLLPMLAYVSTLPPITLRSSEDNEDGPYALVMAPTRELALQIEVETVKFARYLGIKVVSIVGGQSIQEQAFKIRQGCEVVIATPGRLIDCLERRYVVLNRCNYVVLDEADRMIDMGFEPQVVGVLDAIPSSNLKPENEYEEELDGERRIYRTTYMFSATMPPAVERLARKYLRNPVVVTVGGGAAAAGKTTTTDLITQHVVMVRESEKMPRLLNMLNELGRHKTAIVFVNERNSADTLSRALDKAGYSVTSLHGGKSQEQREISLDGFKTNRFNVLIATDIMGRGIDIPNVTHVINYDMPKTIQTYTHRIGRTGRAGNTGVATTFLTRHDTDVFYDLTEMLIQSNSPVPLELSKFKPCKF